MLNRILFAIILHLLVAQPGYCATQPNDNFAGRILLTGNDLTFTGSLSGSTIEAGEPIFDPGGWFPSAAITHSVWWSWTATESGPVTFAALSYSVDTYIQGYGDLTCALAVYAGTNIFGNPPASSTNVLRLNALLNKASISFPAVAGTSYQIQFSGVHPTLAVTFQLISTNPPVILEPPIDQATFPDGCALFTVIATGLSAPGYQWRFNGVDLPGATSPMLGLYNVTTNQAGAYSVLVSNSTGTTIAGPAQLTVNSNPLNPVLGAGGGTVSNRFGFSVTGEQGRYYRILSSTNLSDWRSERSFPATSPKLIDPPGALGYRSVVFQTNSTISLSIPKSSNAAFVRALLYSAPDEVCNNHLKQIRFAQQLWGRSVGLSRYGWFSMLDLQPYCPEISSFKCPMGGTFFADSYVIGDLWLDPVCQKAWTVHVLEEP